MRTALKDIAGFAVFLLCNRLPLTLRSGAAQVGEPGLFSVIRTGRYASSMSVPQALIVDAWESEWYRVSFALVSVGDESFIFYVDHVIASPDGRSNLPKL
jgi:hypothetical protein